MSKASLHARAKRRDELVPESGIIDERHHGVHDKCDAEIDRLTRELARLRAWMDENRDKTADGKWADECGNLYCPKCAEDIDDIRDERAYCWSCKGEEHGSSACFFLSQCYSTREAALAANVGKEPLICLKCGTDGPLHPSDGDHAGWMCDDCYAAAQESSP